jgi:AraC-like DNA-binding protein
MMAFEFLIDNPVEYVYTGTFEAPTPNWMHEEAPLIDYELIVITEGTLYLSYNNQKYAASAGDLLLLPPYPAPYNRRNGYAPSDCSFYWLHFSCKYDVCAVSIDEDLQIQDSNWFNTKNKILIPEFIKIPKSEKVIVLMKQLQDAVRSQYNKMALDYISTVILFEIYNQFFAKSIANTQSKKSQRQMHHDILDFISQNHNNNIKVSDIAEHFGYNEKYLSHMFRTVSGVSLKQFILKTKIDSANFMLTDSNMKIGEIATALGFSDSHNFMKCYKKITGLTPSEYRNAFPQRMLFHK